MADTLEPIKGLIQRVKGVISRQKSGENSGLRIVKDPKHAEIDIVAVHGLGGEGFKSWITQDPGTSRTKSWLEELLAKDIPHARIMTYGYISEGVNYRYLVRNVLYGRALDMVKELGVLRRRDATNKRPLFFIAHSLGGWIVKRALIISNEAADSLLRDIELACLGVAFFGTLSPGRPSSPSPLAHVIRRTTSNFKDDLNKNRPRVPQLKSESSDVEWLENQMEAFKAITTNLPRISFYETKTSEEGFVVEKRYSMAGSDGAQIGLKATHSDLIKFEGRDANYKTFIARFREMIDKATSSDLLHEKRKVFDLAAVHHLEYLRKDYSVPYKLPREPDSIVSRPDLMHNLDDMLNRSIDSQQSQIGIVTLWGVPGTGKTTLAKHWAETHKSDVSFVFWIWAESWETVVASYLNLANNLLDYYSKEVPRERVENDLGLMGVEEMLRAKSVLQLDTTQVKSVVQAVKDWLLRPDNDQWLLIFDNVESSYNIFEFIPLTLSGRIILTSRDSNCCEWGTQLHVDSMTPTQSVELLLKGVDDDAPKSPEDAAAATRLVRHLKYHPQSISLTASTIRKKGLTITEYEAGLELELPLRIVGSTIDMSPLTKTIMRISAMLSSSVIPVAIFSAGSLFQQAPPVVLGGLESMKMFQDASHLDAVLQHLLDQSFIQTPSPMESSVASSGASTSSTSFDYFILDPAARTHVRTSLTASEKLQHAWLACHVCVDGIRQKEADSTGLHEIHDFGRVMAPHAKTCFDDWSGILENSNQDDGIAWQVLGQVCMTQGAMEQAIGCFELSLKQSSNMTPMDRIQTSLSLATLLQQAGKHARSREVLTNINIPSLDQALGFRVAMAKASAAVADGELDRAEDQYEMLEQEQEEALGPTNAATVGTVQKLAATLERLGKLEEARALYRRVFISHQNTLGQNHPATLEALDDLAAVSRASNAVDEAEALLRQAVDIKTRTLGPDHPGTAHSIGKLAVIDDMRGRYDEARLKYQKALAIMARTLGAAHPMYTTTAENMALSSRLHAQSLYDADEGAFADPADAPHHHQTSRGATAVMRETTRRRAFDEAERLYLEVLASQRAAPRSLYPAERVLETGSKLREMYENEAYFAPRCREKVEELMELLREGRRRGTL